MRSARAGWLTVCGAQQRMAWMRIGFSMSGGRGLSSRAYQLNHAARQTKPKERRVRLSSPSRCAAGPIKADARARGRSCCPQAVVHDGSSCARLVPSQLSTLIHRTHNLLRCSPFSHTLNNTHASSAASSSPSATTPTCIPPSPNASQPLQPAEHRLISLDDSYSHAAPSRQLS